MGHFIVVLLLVKLGDSADLDIYIPVAGYKKATNGFDAERQLLQDNNVTILFREGYTVDRISSAEFTPE